VLAGEIDAALVAEPVAEARSDTMVAFEEEPVLVTSAAHPPMDPAAGQVPKTMIVFEHGCPHRRRLEAWYASRCEMPERTIELGSYHAMLGCVLAGMGAALLPRSVLDTFPESRRLHVHALPQGEDRLRTLLIWRKGVSSPKIDALARILGAGASQDVAAERR
jgi:DNA-binding transcriptional LysR family regulator